MSAASPLQARTLLLFPTAATPAGTIGRLSTTERTNLPTYLPNYLPPYLPTYTYPAHPGWVCGACVGFGFCLSPHQSWLGCCGVFFVCALRLNPANPCWGCSGVCFGVGALPVVRQSWLAFVVCPSGFEFWLSSGRSWLGCSGVYVCVCTLLVPRHSWLVFAVWMCVLGFWFPLHPAIPVWGVGVSVFVCALRL